MLPGALPYLDEEDDEDDDDEKEDDAARPNGSKKGRLGAEDALSRVGLVVLVDGVWNALVSCTILVFLLGRGGGGVFHHVVLLFARLFGDCRVRNDHVRVLAHFHDDLHGARVADSALPVLQPFQGPVGRGRNKIVDVLFELQAHVVWTELLKLDGKLDVLRRLVAVDQYVGVQDCAAGVCLLLLHQVQLVELIRSPHIFLRTDNIQLVSNLRVNDKSFP